PVAPVPGEALFEAEARALGDPERRLVAGADLQPDPGDAEAAVGPPRRGTYGPRGDAPAPLFGPRPVGQFHAARAVGHQPDRAEQPLAVQDSEGELASGGPIPGRQCLMRVVQRVGSRGTGTPQ